MSRRTLAALPAGVRRPDYDPAELRAGIVHLGVGAFQRAHQAAYTQPLLARSPEWGILGASLRRGDTRAALAPQDFLYTLAQRDGDGERLEVVGSLVDVLVAPETPATLIARMADPAVRIVTLTVTEKAYFRNAATGELDEADPAIRADLADPARPATALGFMAAALRARRAAGVPPFSILSCDNLPANGQATHRVLSRFAGLLEPGFGHWVEDEVACPDSMVDRIVPATTDADRARISAALGVADAWPVIAEPYTQWVIEEKFPLGRPAWETAGAQLVRAVRPFEDMKLRLLNGSHSTIAYLGQLAGWRTVADAMADPDLADHVAALMAEVAPTLKLPSEVDVVSYQRSLIARFSNPALRHLTAQIAMDGSQKLPQRLLAPARELLAGGADVRRIALGLAAWLQFLRGRSDAGVELPLDDPMAERLRAAAGGADSPRALLDAVFALPGVVPSDLAGNEVLRTKVLAVLENLAIRGAKATLQRWRIG